MRFYFLLFILLSIFISSCQKDEKYSCRCEFPFVTGNSFTTFFAVHNESYWYNDDCWTYLGPTKGTNSPPPANPGVNSNEWRRCADIHKDCGKLNLSTPTWSAGVYYKGNKVKLNNKIFIAFTQGGSMPDAPDDDIWAELCK